MVTTETKVFCIEPLTNCKIHKDSETPLCKECHTGF